MYHIASQRLPAPFDCSPKGAVAGDAMRGLPLNRVYAIMGDMTPPFASLQLAWTRNLVTEEMRHQIERWS